MMKFEQIKNSLKNTIEPKMLDIVTALTCLGIKVDKSSAGDINKEININIDTSKDLLVIEKELKDSINFYPFVEIKNEETDKENLLHLMDLIDEFYQNKITPASRVLTITHILMRKVVLKPQMGDISAKEQDKNKRQKFYDEFHNDFKELAEFLKSKINER